MEANTKQYTSQQAYTLSEHYEAKKSTNYNHNKHNSWKIMLKIELYTEKNNCILIKDVLISLRTLKSVELKFKL